MQTPPTNHFPSLGTGSLTAPLSTDGKTMPGNEPQYEVTEIKAIRGTEPKAIANKQREGWELLSQQQGRVRTTLHFRRPKPPIRWKMWAALGGAGIILASIITVGALLEEESDASAADNSAAASTEQPSPAPDSGDESAPASATDPMICETRPGGDPCKFGQTAIYSDAVRGGEVKLEITVGEPVEFAASEGALVAYDLPLQPVSVYFPITIKNLSSISPDMIQSQVINAQQGEYDGVQELSDGDVESYAASGANGLSAGQTLSVKDGWNMATLVGVEYRLSIDGLAGYDIEFMR